MRLGRRGLFAVVLLVVMAAGVSAEDAGKPKDNGKTKKFLSKPLMIEDQGSFFIGVVP
jgi:hypothetical protein